MKKSKKQILLKLLAAAIILSSFRSYITPPENKVFTSAQRMYNAITLYADSFGVPLHIAFNIAYIETTYRGPNDSLYNHRKTSKCGALGPMQIMPQYASYHAGFPVTKKALRDSIELNVMISMKIMAANYKKTKSWAKAAGKYHTGRACVDSYAKKAIIKNYQKNWIHTDTTQYVQTIE